MIDWLKWSLFGVSVIVLIMLILYLTNVFKQICPSGQHFDTQLKQCIPVCLPDQKYYSEVSACVSNPSSLCRDDKCLLTGTWCGDKQSCIHGKCTKFACTWRGKCLADEKGTFDTMENCKTQCLDPCAKCDPTKQVCCQVGGLRTPAMWCLDGDKCCSSQFVVSTTELSIEPNIPIYNC